MAKRIGSVNQFQYCPYCGQSVSREQVPVRWTVGGEVAKTNIVVKCPRHGKLYITP